MQRVKDIQQKEEDTLKQIQFNLHNKTDYDLETSVLFFKFQKIQKDDFLHYFRPDHRVILSGLFDAHQARFGIFDIHQILQEHPDWKIQIPQNKDVYSAFDTNVQGFEFFFSIKAGDVDGNQIMFLLCGPPMANQKESQGQFSVPEGSFLLYEGMDRGYGRRSVYVPTEK